MVSATQETTQQIWSEFGDRLRAFIARRVGSEADADDILQDVFLRIHRHAGSVEQSERLVSWLFQVTRNAIVDHYRAPERRRELPSGAAQDLEREWNLAWDGDDRDLDSLAARRELSACLRPMIARLPPLYREAVALVDLDGLPQQEAAARAGLSLSGMKSRVQRGRQALKALLHDCCRIEPDAGGRVTDFEPPAAGCGSGCEPDNPRRTGLAAARVCTELATDDGSRHPRPEERRRAVRLAKASHRVDAASRSKQGMN
jgi:RNA polymerase sigma-70 factor (ECF subfamily)